MGGATVQPDCLFCRIAGGKTPDEIIWQGRQHTAFLDFRPNCEGATVVVPNHHFSSNFCTQLPHTRQRLIEAVTAVTGILLRAFPDVERCGIVLEGYGVDHLHAKVYPLHGTRGPDGELIVIRAQVHDFYPTYPGHIASHSDPACDPDVLAEVAQRIRAAA